MSIYSFRKRAFLNPVSTNHTSYILAHVEDSKEGTEKYGANLIILADCEDKIELEFFLGNARSRRLSLKKINLLISVITSFRDALVKEIELIDNAK